MGTLEGPSTATGAGFPSSGLRGSLSVGESLAGMHLETSVQALPTRASPPAPPPLSPGPTLVDAAPPPSPAGFLAQSQAGPVSLSTSGSGTTGSGPVSVSSGVLHEAALVSDTLRGAGFLPQMGRVRPGADTDGGGRGLAPGVMGSPGWTGVSAVAASGGVPDVTGPWSRSAGPGGFGHPNAASAAPPATALSVAGGPAWQVSARADADGPQAPRRLDFGAEQSGPSQQQRQEVETRTAPGQRSPAPTAHGHETEQVESPLPGSILSAPGSPAGAPSQDWGGFHAALQVPSLDSSARRGGLGQSEDLAPTPGLRRVADVAGSEVLTTIEASLHESSPGHRMGGQGQQGLGRGPRLARHPAHRLGGVTERACQVRLLFQRAMFQGPWACRGLGSPACRTLSTPRRWPRTGRPCMPRRR